LANKESSINIKDGASVIGGVPFNQFNLMSLEGRELENQEMCVWKSYYKLQSYDDNER